MDDCTFDELDQAAVAGADGAVWPMSIDLPTCSSLPSASYLSTFSTSPFDTLTEERLLSHAHTPSAPIPIPMPAAPRARLDEPASTPVTLPSSPSQPSLCSFDSALSTARPHSATSSAPIAIPARPPQPLAKPPRAPSSFASAASSAAPLSAMAADPASAPERSFIPDLSDLTGTTAARSRKMTEEERKIMLHKRRLRNRASAARSREKRSRTLNDLTAEVEDLMKRSAGLALQASQAKEEARKLHAKNVMLAKENELLKAELKL